MTNCKDLVQLWHCSTHGIPPPPDYTLLISHMVIAVDAHCSVKPLRGRHISEKCVKYFLPRHNQEVWEPFSNLCLTSLKCDSGVMDNCTAIHGTVSSILLFSKQCALLLCSLMCTDWSTTSQQNTVPACPTTQTGTVLQVLRQCMCFFNYIYLHCLWAQSSTLL